MSHLSWTRAAYVLFALAVLTALLKSYDAGPVVGSRPLASRSAEGAATAGEGHAIAGGSAIAGEGSAIAGGSARAGGIRRTVVEGGGAPVPEEGTTSGGTTVERPASGTSDAVSRQSSRATVSTAGSDESPTQGAPVFRRPSFRAPIGGGVGPALSPASGPVCGDLGNFPRSSKAIFPLPRRYLNSYGDTWGAPRVQGPHEGTDLMAPIGVPEYAVTDGTLVPVSGSNADGWNTLGGYAVMLRADYSVGPIHAGDLFYYAHMNRESPLPIGTHVRAGQVLGVVGNTGQGPEGTRGLFPSHLHFGWYDMSGARTNLPSGAMNPYPLLQWLKTNGGTVTGGSDASYCIAPQRETPTPSAGGRWPSSGSPGRQPDLDTGTREAAPSPIVEESVRPHIRHSNQRRRARTTRPETQTSARMPVAVQAVKPAKKIPEGPEAPARDPQPQPDRPQSSSPPAPRPHAGVHEKPLPRPNPPRPVVRPERPASVAPARGQNHALPGGLPGVASGRPYHPDGASFRRWLNALIRHATARVHTGEERPAGHGPRGKKSQENAAGGHEGHAKPNGAGDVSGQDRPQKPNACPAPGDGACKEKKAPGVTVPPSAADTTAPEPATAPSSGGTTGSIAPVPPDPGAQGEPLQTTVSGPQKTSPDLREGTTSQ